MSRQIVRFSFVLLLCLLGLAGPILAKGPGWQMIHGEILQVFSEQGKVLLRSEGQRCIFVLEPDCEILRCGKPASLDSLRPITERDFQDALCWLNSRGQVSYLLVNYRVVEESGCLTHYDIFGKIK